MDMKIGSSFALVSPTVNFYVEIKVLLGLALPLLEKWVYQLNKIANLMQEISIHPPGYVASVLYQVRRRVKGGLMGVDE
eukprot:snap_masked-scaffold_5-processed-gene-17.33-mRNA-1 protein AED:1.00 eAED:1.00 QI:0/0/0/0/1/1/3/0/78